MQFIQSKMQGGCSEKLDAVRERRNRDKTTLKYLSYMLVQSQFGEIGIVWKSEDRDAKIIHVFLSKPGKKMKQVIREVYPYVVSGSASIIDKICRKFRQYFEGEPIDFPLDSIVLKQLYGFQKKVLLLERQIPYGQVSTYGKLAHKLGHPGAARAVGTALARNPFPIIIPCHRTIRSDGSLGGFGGGLKLKRQLLELEGVRFDQMGRVVMDKVW